MKLRKLIFMTAMAMAMALPALAQQAQPIAEPKMVMEAFAHDFGEVKSGTPLTFSFVVKNQGKADLLIKGVAPG